MSSNFWAGYLSGAAGIVIGNPLDLIKVRLQAGVSRTDALGPARSYVSQFEGAGSLVRGAAAPILGYGALNAILFVAYNRSLVLLDSSVTDPITLQGIPLQKIWLAGAAGGLASWVISSPTEFIKCRAQLESNPRVSSWSVAKDIFRARGWKGLYFGGGITSARDTIGYGFYFWSYEYCKRLMISNNDDAHQSVLKVLLCGGIAGIATWASVFPLDMIKTRLQAQIVLGRTSTGLPGIQRPLLRTYGRHPQTVSSSQIAIEVYQSEGLRAFYRGLGVCSVRAFIVNAVQWASYEWFMKIFNETWKHGSAPDVI